MKKLFLLIGIFFLLAYGERGIILPVYFYNLSDWQKLVKLKINMIAIINPLNGPGNRVDKNYKKFIFELVKNNKIPIGYVYTKWGNRNFKEVKKDIDTWLKFYPNIKGFFIDEAASDVKKLKYYQNLKRYINSKGDYLVVLNPGVVPHKAYFNIADNIVVYENDVSKLNDEICFNKSSLIVYGANENQMKVILKKYKCKYMYITDDTLPNPYDSLPAYFSKEIELIK